jgi:hypothetical protein
MLGRVSRSMWVTNLLVEIFQMTDHHQRLISSSMAGVHSTSALPHTLGANGANDDEIS